MTARILIIDDDPFNISLIEGILAKQPYLIESCDSADITFPLLEKKTFNLVLCDVIMPGINGLDITAKIKELYPDLPVIQMTSISDVAYIERAFDVGAVDFIQKPIRAVELRMRVRNILKIKQTQDYLNLALHELNEKIRKLELMVVTDSLTGLYNHKYIIERLGAEIAGAKRYKKNVSIVMFDLDYFKSVNDTYGHQAGDDVLERISNIIREETRETDIAGRYGGEEFMVILPNIGLEGGNAFAEKIRKKVNEIKWKYKGLTTTISAGVAEYKDGQTPKELIAHADKLLYQAKSLGRNRVESELIELSEYVKHINSDEKILC